MTDDFFKFIENNKREDPQKLRLKTKKESLNFDLDFALTQIEGRKKYAIKLKNFLSYPNFLFPDRISGEQSSHQAVAIYHAGLLNKGENVLDMTAGLGIDTISMAIKNLNVTAIELDNFKADILKENTKTISLNHKIKVLSTDSISFLKDSSDHYDLIFVDPARRDSSNKKVYNLHDCSPDVINHQKLILGKASSVLIKASPLLDITQTIKDFDNITSISAIGVKGECKEVLIELQAGTNSNEIILHAINLDNEGNVISRFNCNKNLNSDGARSTINNQDIKYLASERDLHSGIYILEPSAMIMKLSPWQEICNRYNARKFGPSSHLFVSDQMPVDFPGRITKFERILTKKDRKSISGLQASVVCRNHPMSVDEIRKSLKLKEGDSNFIYASRVVSKPIFFLTSSLFQSDDQKR